MQGTLRGAGKCVVAVVQGIVRWPARVCGRILLDVAELAWAMRPPTENAELREKLERLAANPPEGWQVMYDPTPEQMLARAAAIQTNIESRQAHAADLQNLVLDESRKEARRVAVLTKAVVVLSTLVVVLSVANLVVLVVSLL
jgi:hypothetical protein